MNKCAQRQKRDAISGSKQTWSPEGSQKKEGIASISKVTESLQKENKCTQRQRCNALSGANKPCHQASKFNPRQVS
jgi:hypothetical protein